MIRVLLKWLLNSLWWDWQHVGTFKDGGSSYQRAYIHCFESRWGSRKVKIVLGDHSPYNKMEQKNKVRHRDLYQTEIYPWLKGRANSSVPSYQRIRSGRFDFKRLLSGKSSTVLNDGDDSDKDTRG